MVGSPADDDVPAAAAVDLPAGFILFRMVSANVWSGSSTLPLIASEVAAARADVVILQEVTPEHLETIEEVGAFADLPHHTVTASDGHRGMGIWSRFELSEAQSIDAGGEPQLRTSVRLPGGPAVSVYGIHLPAPLPGRLRAWRSSFRVLCDEAARVLLDPGRPTVMAGDFNAMAYLPQFRALLRAGLRDAAVGRGRLSRMTWPNHRWLPPLFRLDHVLVSPAISVRSHRVGRGLGSDHRPLFVDLLVSEGRTADRLGSAKGERGRWGWSGPDDPRPLGAEVTR